MARNVDTEPLPTADSPQDAINSYCGFSAKTITDRHRADILKDLRRLEKIRISKSKKIAHLSFLKIAETVKLFRHLLENFNKTKIG